MRFVLFIIIVKLGLVEKCEVPDVRNFRLAEVQVVPPCLDGPENCPRMRQTFAIALRRNRAIKLRDCYAGRTWRVACKV